jgi:hypothetical protein
MHEVVIERPRGGWRVPRRVSRYDWRAHDDEALPKRESTSRHRGGTKWLSDHLGPLRRFLDGAVGRPWDDVYAELRAAVPPRSLLHLHILEHVDRYVGRHPWVPGRYRICPDTGVLLRA